MPERISPTELANKFQRLGPYNQALRLLGKYVEVSKPEVVVLPPKVRRLSQVEVWLPQKTIVDYSALVDYLP